MALYGANAHVIATTRGPVPFELVRTPTGIKSRSGVCAERVDVLRVRVVVQGGKGILVVGVEFANSNFISLTLSLPCKRNNAVDGNTLVVIPSVQKVADCISIRPSSSIHKTTLTFVAEDLGQ